LDGHVPRQVQGVPLERPGVVLFGVCEPQLDLADVLAFETEEPRHLELEEHRLGPDGHGAEGPVDAPLGPDLGAAAVGAPQAVPGFLDANDHPPRLEPLAAIAIADQTEAVIQ
jgi:hypothetical protein